MIVSKFSIIILFFLIVGCTQGTPQQNKSNSEKKTVTLAFAGDVLLDRKVKTTIDSLGQNEFISRCYKFQTDYAIVNFENPATENGIKRKKKFTFNARPDAIEILKKIGVTHANLSNNHSIDCGRNGLIQTVFNLNSFNIKTTGYGKTQEETCNPTILRKNDQEIAIFSTVGIPIEYYYSLNNKPGICTMSVEDICNNVSAFNKQNPNVKIFVQIHWGTEYKSEPDLTQRKHAHQLIDAGADVIIGHHPHVIQTIELYKDKPIFYSVGNFIFDLSNPQTHIGIVPIFTIQGEQIRYQIDSVNLSNHIPSKI